MTPDEIAFAIGLAGIIAVGARAFYLDVVKSYASPARRSVGKQPKHLPPPVPWRDFALQRGFLPRRDTTLEKRIDPRIALELSALSGGRRHGRLQCRARLDPPLGVAFAVKPYDGSRETQVRIHHDFDLRFIVLSEERERSKNLLTACVETLLEVEREGWRVELSQREVTLSSFHIPEEDELDALCAGAARLARALIDAEDSIASIVPYAIVKRIWLGAAHSISGKFDPERRRLSAATAYGKLRAELSTAGDDRWGAAATFELERPLSPEFTLVDEPAPLGSFVTGDDEFDAAFSLTTDDESAIGRVMDGDARARLLELVRRVAWMRASHERIEVELGGRIATDDDLLSESLKALLAAGEALAIVGTHGARGAYR